MEDTPKRKPVADTLRASQERFRQSYNTTPAMMHSIDRDVRLVSVNDYWLKALGYAQDDVLGHPLTEFMTDASRQYACDVSLPRFYRDGFVMDVPLQFVKKNGDVIETLLSATTVSDDAGNFLRSMAIITDITDITERKLAEDALLESERQSRKQLAELELLYRTAPLGLCHMDTDLRYLRCNEKLAEINGLPSADHIGRTLREIVPQIADTMESVYRQVIESGEPVIDVVASGATDADPQMVRHFSANYYPVKSEDGVVQGVSSIVQDITERKQAQEALAQLQRQNELILRTAGEGIYGLDAEGKTTFVNPAAAKMLGWDAEELIGQPMHALLHHSKPDGSPYPATECPIYAAFKDGNVHRVDDEVFWRKDGSSFSIEYTSTPILEDGKLAGAVVVFWDITERTRAEEALRGALTEVKQLKERLQAENIYLREEIDLDHNFGEIIGQNKGLKKVLLKVEQVAATDATVLILGETGTGKELLARAVHGLSQRKDRPLVKVNCAALPPGLIESELFGHAKGAFTGAVSKQVGRFELANGATMLLDEIGELPRNLQAKLLRVLQEGEFERLGSPRTFKVDVRIIATTNRDLEQAVHNGEFRKDLYHRLNVFPLTLPSLCERRDDIPPLVQSFVRKYGQKLGKEIDTIPQPTMTALREYSWPGNIRELENVIERAVIVTQGTTLRMEDVLDLSQAAAATGRQTLEDIEREHINQILQQTQWRIEGRSGAAVALGLKAATLRSRLQKLGIRRPR